MSRFSIPASRLGGNRGNAEIPQNPAKTGFGGRCGPTGANGANGANPSGPHPVSARAGRKRGGSAKSAGSAETSKNPDGKPLKRDRDFHAQTCPNLPKPFRAWCGAQRPDREPSSVEPPRRALFCSANTWHQAAAEMPG